MKPFIRQVILVLSIPLMVYSCTRVEDSSPVVDPDELESFDGKGLTTLEKPDRPLSAATERL